MTEQHKAGIILAGTAVARDIPIGTAVTAADIGADAEPTGRLPPCRVLLIDDEPMTRAHI